MWSDLYRRAVVAVDISFANNAMVGTIVFSLIGNNLKLTRDINKAGVDNLVCKIAPSEPSQTLLSISHTCIKF